MLPCAMDSSAAPSAALAAATERPSAVNAAMAEWGAVPQTPTATTTSGSKVNECGSRAPGTRRTIDAHGFRRSHGSYLACLRPIAALRLASSATVNSMGTTTRRSWPRQYRPTALTPAPECGGARRRRIALINTYPRRAFGKRPPAPRNRKENKAGHSPERTVEGQNLAALKMTQTARRRSGLYVHKSRPRVVNVSARALFASFS